MRSVDELKKFPTLDDLEKLPVSEKEFLKHIYREQDEVLTDDDLEVVMPNGFEKN